MSKCGVTAKTRDFGDGKWLQRNGDPLPGLYVTMHIWLQRVCQQLPWQKNKLIDVFFSAEFESTCSVMI